MTLPALLTLSDEGFPLSFSGAFWRALRSALSGRDNASEAREGELVNSDDERWADSFAALLRSLRLETRYTQEVLAEKSGLSVRAIVDLEGGGVLRPQRRSINSLADALGLNPAQRANFADLATRDYWARRQRQERTAGDDREDHVRRLQLELPPG